MFIHFKFLCLYLHVDCWEYFGNNILVLLTNDEDVQNDEDETIHWKYLSWHRMDSFIFDCWWLLWKPMANAKAKAKANKWIMNKMNGLDGEFHTISFILFRYVMSPPPPPPHFVIFSFEMKSNCLYFIYCTLYKFYKGIPISKRKMKIE